jgi:hypothetical protein
LTKSSFELRVDRVGGQQFQAFLLGGQSKLSVGNITIGEAVVRVCRCRIRLDVQSKQLYCLVTVARGGRRTPGRMSLRASLHPLRAPNLVSVAGHGHACHPAVCILLQRVHKLAARTDEPAVGSFEQRHFVRVGSRRTKKLPTLVTVNRRPLESW